MRIAETQKRQIVWILKARYGERSRIWLFGSCDDDDARGGDMDLYVESESAMPAQGAVSRRHEAALALEAVMDYVSVDLSIHYPGDPEPPIQTLART